MDNEFLDSKIAQQSKDTHEIAILALARSINNLAIALSEEEDEDYLIKE